MKRWTLKLILLLLAGAIINIAVAWGLALRITTQVWQPPFEFGVAEDYERNSFKYWRVESQQGFGSHKVVSGWMDVDIWIGGYSGPDETDVLPSWGKFLAPPQHSTPMSMMHVRSAEAWGLPMLSVVATWAGDSPYHRNHRVIERLISGIEVSPKRYLGRRGLFEARRTLPLTPLWPGFAINTIFYAALLWMLLAFPGAVRRRVRINRGQCAVCGYSLRECLSEKCPECGAISSARRAGGM